MRHFTLCAALVLSGCSDPTPPDGDAGDGGRTTMDGGGSSCTDDDACNDGLYCNGAERCMPGTSGADTRGCVEGAARCTASGEACDEDTDACLDACELDADLDDDGSRSIACGGTDCDDDDPERAPGRTEVCDVLAHDEDCDPTTFGFRDADGDGVADARCCNVGTDGALACGRDCDDAAPSSNPTAPEVCDGLDQDCDTHVDEGVQRLFYPDVDGDRFGDRDGTPVEGCTPPPDTIEDDHSDCDDGVAVIHPGVPEVCTPSGVDDNCDGAADEGCACTGTGRPCPGALGACRSGIQPCMGTMWGECSIQPVAESCNAIDDDCDGTTDETVGIECWRDDDSDGRPVPGSRMVVCAATGGGCPSGSVTTAATPSFYDCNDSNPASTGAAFFCYDDDDGDGFAGAAPASVVLCDLPGATCPLGTLRSASPVDCNDGDSAVSPTGTEICNGVDDDCDGALDECATVLNGRRTCVAGACVQTSCVTGYGDCNSSMADGCETDLDELTSCGGCGVVCSAGEGCCGRSCTTLDVQGNCGACGRRCLGATSACCEGTDGSYACRVPSFCF